MSFRVRRSTIGRCLLLAGLILPLLLVGLWPWLSGPWRWLIGATGFLAYFAFLAGTLWPCSGWFAPVVRRFSTSGKEVWLTLDDGPHPRWTQPTLEVLARHKAPATFFVIGREVTRHPDLARAIFQAGHQLANHTHSHPFLTFWCKSRRWLARDVERCARAIQAATGAGSVFFRPPVGMVSPAAGSVTEGGALRLIGWSARGMDATSGAPETIARRVLSKVRPGAIILLHPERRPESVAALELVLAGLEERGYRCVIPNPGRFA